MGRYIAQNLSLTCCQDHILTEIIWFVWSKTSYSGDMRRCHYAGRTDEQLKIELLSQWKLEAEFRNSKVYFMLFFVSGETRMVYEPAPTDFADVRFLSSVNSIVYHQVRISHETFSTFCTTQWLAHPMDICIVSKQTFFELELDVTRVAYSC